MTQFLGDPEGAEHKLLVNIEAVSVTQEIDLGHFQKDRVYSIDTRRAEGNSASSLADMVLIF